MVNEIHNAPKNNQQPVKLESDGVGRASQQLPERSHDASDRPRQGDWVTLTDTVSKLRDIGQRLVHEPVVDTQRVERIKQQLTDGTYKIDAAQIADKLLAHEQLLDGSTSR